jgi:lipoprotein-anchoring transpeptidase ErfK/SrfK
MREKPAALFFTLTAALLLAGCATKDRENKIVISVTEQRLLLLKRDVPVAVFPVSTSKFGLGDRPGSCATPLGRLEVAQKIGAGAPAGMKFKDRRSTGEIVPVDAPGRDPIVTRILWLRGMEAGNRNAFRRTIYIHGTPEERNIGQPASYGCVRMKSEDVRRLFDAVGIGATVEIREAPLPTMNVGG